MTFKKIFLFYFLIIFNIFSDDKIKFTVKIQDVVDDSHDSDNSGKCLKDLFSKEISIEKNKLNKDKYKSEELIELLGVNEDSGLKTYISNKNFLIEIDGIIFLKNEEIADKYLKDEKYKSRKIKFRDKRKYDFKLYNRCKVKDKITVNNKNYSKQDFINTCDLIDKRLNNENCCFLDERDIHFITVTYDIFKIRIYVYKFFIKNNYIYFYDDINIYCDNIKCVAIFNNNKKINVEFLSAKNLYDVVTILTSKFKKTDGDCLRYIDIKEVKYNENKSFNFNEKLEKYNVDKINEELKKIDVDIYKNFTMILNIGFREKEIKKEKKEDKKLTYCQRVKC